MPAETYSIMLQNNSQTEAKKTQSMSKATYFIMLHTISYGNRIAHAELTY